MELDDMFAEIASRDQRILDLTQENTKLERELDRAKAVIDIFTKRSKNLESGPCVFETVCENCKALDVLQSYTPAELVAKIMHNACVRSVAEDVAMFRSHERTEVAPVLELAESVREVVVPIVKGKVLETCVSCHESNLNELMRHKSSTNNLNVVVNSSLFCALFKKFLKKH